MSTVTSDAEMLAETRAFNADLERRLAAEPSVHTVPVTETRRRRRDGTGPFPAPVFLDRARDVTIDGRSGPLRLRVLAPLGEALGAYLHVHGGGWTLSAADMQDPLLAELADATGLCAVSVDYRLAPEHPYPAAPDDCEDAALWLLRHGLDELGLPPVVTIGGDSAGAHLSAVTLLRLRDRHGIDAVRAANLIYGAFDLALTPSQRNWGERNLILTTPIIRWFGDQFLPGVAADARRDPDISPLYAELHGLPPALFTVGTLDPLLDDSLFMEARWRAAGNHGELRVWPEAIHGFNAFPLAVTAAAREAQYAFLRGAVGGA
ncbi:MAG: acetyl esterase [Solirubrobacteraceae bacterium]|jgi:acetyl esterase/lipase|nr:acetyl esterase [Solirubrobacteraceae bacterium]